MNGYFLFAVQFTQVQEMDVFGNIVFTVYIAGPNVNKMITFHTTFIRLLDYHATSTSSRFYPNGLTNTCYKEVQNSIKI